MTVSSFCTSASPTFRRTTCRRALRATATAAVLTLALAACGSSGKSSSMPGMDHGGASSASKGAMPSVSPMPGMDHLGTSGTGLADVQDGYRLTSPDTTLAAAKRSRYRFTITGPDGKPVTDFALSQTKRMHFYAIRSDLTGFQHLHPTMAADGTWTADLAALSPGAWRLFASFSPRTGSGNGRDFVLSRTATVPGTATGIPLPAAATLAQVDGYTVTVQGEPMAGMAHPLTATFTRNGKPVTDLQPYLASYAHLTAFHEGDAAFAHLHPTTEVTGHGGGPELAFHAELPSSGNWRLFLQFQTGGTLHTAALTLHVA